MPVHADPGQLPLQLDLMLERVQQQRLDEPVWLVGQEHEQRELGADDEHRRDLPHLPQHERPARRGRSWPDVAAQHLRHLLQ